MRVSAANAEAFRREAPASGRVWTVRDAVGYLAPRSGRGRRAMPFWSSRARVQHIIDAVPAYQDVVVDEIELDFWLDRWLPGLASDGLLVGINWAGPRASGYDVPSAEVVAWFEALGHAAPSRPG